jgi:phenolic acid decarboxylase
MTLHKAAQFPFCLEHKISFWMLYSYKNKGKLRVENHGTGEYPRWVTTEKDIIECYIKQNPHLDAEIKATYPQYFAS